MLANKSGMDRLADLAHHAKALKDIIKAALRGGWHAAALQAVKHYWPQILAIALVLLFLPLLIFLCLPAMLFGFGSSGGGATASMSLQATTVKGYYDRYAEYCTARIESIQKAVIAGDESGGPFMKCRIRSSIMRLSLPEHRWRRTGLSPCIPSPPATT